MAGDSENKVKVLAQNDPFSAQNPHFDFQELRREGLKHIGELSGKIWTDHNTHDPGITILEELCYALIDLGYRTTLPMEDLLAEPRGNSTPGADSGSPHHENFFTPYEILSCNPTTVLDFRKLLLEVDGVRNAWLEPIETDAPTNPAALNGLYSILIQKESGGDDEAIKSSVREMLSAHRNLCEDFSEIKVLRPLEVGVCADVEIGKTADVSLVYESIIRAVKAYIVPEVQYYTLKELLDKGRAIEEIFAGRPMWRSNNAGNTLRSVGFVDTEELEALPFREELHGSDLYSAILAVEGVVAVRNLVFQISVQGEVYGKTIPCVIVAPGSVAEFSLDRTCINLRTAQGRVFLDKDRITARLERGGKPRRGYEYLDLPVPEGRHRPQLAEYYSIQHDFPLVYGIGSGGLPVEAPLLRKVQARQLKGYLLFYDQLLANYLAQIANLRHLFSLRQESKRPDIAKHTYFSQSVESVPDWQRLLPAYSARVLADGSILAIPVANDAQLAKKLEDLKAFPLQELRITASCKPVQDEMPHFAVSSQSLLEIHIRQSIRDFRQNAYSLELRRDGNGYLFILRFRHVCEWLLISFHRYQSLDEAREAAHFTIFLASQPEYYSRRLQQVGADSQHIGHQFDLVYDSVAYAAYLQFLVENEDLYLQRREAFLDHLLARFAHQFTDYALLRFGAEVNGKPERRQTVEDKSRFLSQLDSLSRDRGRAFDYLQPSWGTENVSGFEKRVSLLAGMPEFKRRHLSKFEVVERFRIEMEDPDGKPWFTGIETYRSRGELGAARKDLVGKLGDTATYDRLRFQFRGFDPAPIRRIFSRAATAENIEPSRYVYALVLKDSNGHALTESRTQNYATEVLAWQELSRFIEEIKEGEGKELVETGAESRLYIDNRQLQCCIDTIITYKWHRYDSQGGHSASASAAHPSFASAIDDFAENGEYGDLIVAKADVALWSLCPGKGHPPLVSIHAFNNEVEAQHAWRRCKHDGQLRERYQHAPEPGGTGIRVTLATASGFELASTTIADEQALSPDQYIGLCMAAFGRDAGKLAFPALPTAFGWRLAQPTDIPDRDVECIESVLLFRDIPGALFGLIYALEAAKQANNYYEAGTEDNPDYRILLRSSCGLFIATTQSYTDATERNQNLGIVKCQMMALCPPLEVKEEPRRYRWELYRTTDGQVVFECGQGRDFDSAEVAGKDFEQAIRRVFEECPKSPLGRQVYSFGLKSIEDKYRFIYCLNDSTAEALPLLRSKDEFNAGEVREKYTRFVAALPQMVMEILNGAALVSGNDAPAAVLVDDTETNREKVNNILRYMRVQYGDDKEASASSKWIYRLLDRDNPLAKSQKSYQTMDEVEKAKQALCRFDPCPLIPQKDVIRVICSEGKPNKYHYALFLGTTTDRSGDECATLISYMGYTNEDAARKAGEENWLKLIELAADAGNYGDGKLIAVKEVYAQSTGSECDRASVHLAVRPDVVDTKDAVARARCYPIRITYKEDDKGRLTPEIIGFHFQGYDRKTDASVWRSTVDYRDIHQALDAYQLFLTLLGNSDSCRIECEDGCYRIHLLEILAESGEFDNVDKAWGDLEIVEDECGRRACPAQGVRLFAQTAISEAAFVPVRDGDCYRFDVVGNGCVLASHPHSHPDRTSAMRAEERARACVRDEGMHLVEHILLRPKEDSECSLPSCPDSECTLEWRDEAYPNPNDSCMKENIKALSYIPGADPYSFWATVVLPSWTERFRNSERRHFFRQMLYREVPVMVGLNIVWLDPRQMHDFEMRLKPWLSSMQSPSAICEDCQLLLEVASSDDPEDKIVSRFKTDFEQKKTECAVLIVATGNDPQRWTIAGFNGQGEFCTVVIGDDNQELSRELQKEPKNECKIIRLAIFRLGCIRDNNPFCNMVEAIEELCNEPPCPDPAADAAECHCVFSADQTPVDECIEAAESLFWLACRQGREPGAPLHEIATSTLALDASAIRKVLNDRAERYKKHVNDIDYVLAKETESYKRASHFLSNPPTVDAFKLLAGQMQDDIKRKGTKKGAVLLTVFSNAFWYLLDHLLSEHPTEVVSDAEKMLPSLLQEMENKGAVLKDLAEGWQGGVFGELFGTTAAKVVNGYLTLVSRD